MDLCRKKAWLVLLGTIVLLGEILSSDGCIEEERRALLDFKASYSNDSLLPSWSVDDPKSNCCAWERVTCDSSSSHVISLSLEALNRNIGWDGFFREPICSNHTTLNWSIFFYIKDLRRLNLSSNCFDGFIHEGGLCKMKKLQELDLSANGFRGTLDICLGNLTSLQILDLSYNSLTGSIPTPLIARLASVEYLSLSSNNFEGLFSLNVFANHSKLKGLQLNCMNSKSFQVETENPPWIASFQLKHLEISHCQINLPTKIIPTFLTYQNSLRYIDLSSNHLVGMFPNWLLVNNSKLEAVFFNDNSFTGPFELPFDPNHGMDQLHELDLSNNQIQGELPSNIGFLFPSLRYFHVSNNMFDGHIPASIGEISNLIGLLLGNNKFSGEVPKHIFTGCISLKYFLVDDNQLNGTLLDGIGKLGLSILSASRNNFEGPITKEICQLKLKILDLSHNKFTGSLPSCFKMPSVCILHENNLSGTIPVPKGLRSNFSVWGIDLSNNKFNGTIPERIYGFSELNFLLLAGNQLQGQISSHICQLKNIGVLDLSRNNFTGSIPSCFNHFLFGKKNFSSPYEAFPLSNSLTRPTNNTCDFANLQFITKSLSLSYKGNILGDISALDLSSNQFTGKIPYQIGDLHALHSLNLSHNSLNGPIPKTFHMLQNIESLDLSNNNLSGQIPLQLQDLHSLSVFNVSYNNLSGEAPTKEQFGTFDESSYKGNPYLTWSNSNRGNLTQPPPPIQLNDGEKNNSAIDFTSFYWTFTASYVMILLVLTTILWINPHWRRAWFCFVEGCLLKCFGQFLEDAFY